MFALVLSLSSGNASAGYAQVAPPVGWSPGVFNTGAAVANEASYLNGYVRTTGILNVAGRSVTVPAAMRFAANAGQFAVKTMFSSPLAIGVAGAAWLAQECIAYQGGQFVLTCGAPGQVQSDGWQYPFSFSGPVTGTVQVVEYSMASACGRYVGLLNQNYPAYIRTQLDSSYDGSGLLCGMHTVTVATGAQSDSWVRPPSYRSPSSCPVGWYITPSGCVQTPPPVQISEPDAVSKMAPHPVPDALPRELPGPWPVEPPILNPSPDPTPIPQPLLVPTGDPSPVVPATDPPTWRQPVIRVSPSAPPAPDWQVDLAPEFKISSSPAPMTLPTTPPATDPQGEPKPSGLCDLYPGIVACQQKAKIDELDTPAPDADAFKWQDKSGHDAALQDLRDRVSGDADKQALSSWKNFFITPPLAACEPIPLPSFMSFTLPSLDACPVIDYGRTVAGFFWAFGGLWWCIGMVREVL